MNKTPADFIPANLSPASGYYYRVFSETLIGLYIARPNGYKLVFGNYDPFGQLTIYLRSAWQQRGYQQI